MLKFERFGVFCVFTAVFYVAACLSLAAAENIPRIAVLEIKNLRSDKDTDWIGAATAETLSTKLCGVSSISVVDRSQISNIIKEQKFQRTDLSDPKTAVKIGKLAGADVVVMGSFSTFAGEVQFNVRFVDVKTGEVRNAASLTGKMNEIFQLNYKLATAAIEALNKRVVIVGDIPIISDVSSVRKIKLTAQEKRRLEERGTTSAEAYEYFGRANKFLEDKDGNWDKAIQLYTKAIQIDSGYAWAYKERGIAYDGKGDYDRAIADLDHALKLNPKDAHIYNYRGIVYCSKGDYNQAIEDFNRALEFNPKDAYTYNSRGAVYYYKRDYNRAIADYNYALEINPKYADAYNNRGYIYYYKGEYKKAWEDIRLCEEAGGTPNPNLVRMVKEKLK